MDELDPRLLEAWKVEPLSDGFEDRVMRTWETRSNPARARRRKGSLAVMLACACAAALAVWLAQPGSSSDGVVDLGDYGLATLDRGAMLQTEFREGALVVVQTHGGAEYRIEPGSAVRVETPAATISVRGTTFRVEVEPVQNVAAKRLWGLSGAVLAGTVAVYVAVDDGAVDVHNEHGEMRLKPGESAVATDASAPASATAAPRPVDGAVTVAAVPKRRTLAPRERQAMLKRIDEALTARAAAAKTEHPNASPGEPEPTKQAKLPKPTLDKDYIREVIGNDLVPVAKECYDDALGRNPRLGGRLVMQFTIAGDEEVGGIVETAELGEETDLDDPALRECVVESLMNVAFEPPEGGGRVEVTYPLVFEPGDPENGDQ